MSSGLDLYGFFLDSLRGCRFGINAASVPHTVFSLSLVYDVNEINI